MFFNLFPTIFYLTVSENCYNAVCVSYQSLSHSLRLDYIDHHHSVFKGNEQRAILIDVYACLIEQHHSIAFLCKHNKDHLLLLVLLCAVEIRMMVENPQTNEVSLANICILTRVD